MIKSLHVYYLQKMNIPVYLARNANSTEKSSNLLEQLRQKVATCEQCALCQTRKNTAFSRGNPQAKLMIIGEAPGFHEDQQGLPFVGKAGELLNNMLKSIGLTEQDVYIANVLKCRPPNNRDPQKNEIIQCSTYLTQQIDLVKPKLLIGLGRFAGQFLVNQTLPLKALRTQKYIYNHTPCFISYHPAYLLRNPKDKKYAYEDWINLKNFYDQL